MLEDINKSFKKYALPFCPLWLVLFSPFIITWTIRLVFHIMYPAQMIATFALQFIAIVLLIILGTITYRKRIKAVQNVINEFNQKMAFRSIWAEWNDDYFRIGQRNVHPGLFIKKKLSCDCYHIQIESVQNPEEMVATAPPPSYQDIYG